MLDAGCSAGRFLDVASDSDAEVVGVDISSAIDAAESNLAGRKNVHFVQSVSMSSRSGLECLTGGSYTITPSKEEYEFNPLSRLYEGLDGNKSADFTGMLLPVLMTEDDSDIAVALNALTLVTGPFSLEESSILALGRRTRVTLFARHLDLTLTGEGHGITVQAQDSWGIVYPLELSSLHRFPV